MGWDEPIASVDVCSDDAVRRMRNIGDSTRFNFSHAAIAPLPIRGIFIMKKEGANWVNQNYDVAEKMWLEFKEKLVKKIKETHPGELP